MSAPATAARRPVSSARPRARRSSWLRGMGPAVFGLVTFFGLWQLIVVVTNTPAFIVPAPTVIAKRLWEELPNYAYEFSFTLAAAAIGLVIGTTVGIIGAV